MSTPNEIVTSDPSILFPENADQVTFAVAEITEDDGPFKKGFYYTVPAPTPEDLEKEDKLIEWSGPFETEELAVGAAESFVMDAIDGVDTDLSALADDVLEEEVDFVAPERGEIDARVNGVTDIRQTFKGTNEMNIADANVLDISDEEVDFEAPAGETEEAEEKV